ncbi:glycosyltransferase family 2 protein [Ruminococcus sp. JE7B6]|uniref:glycosyltransferase family 2 protein n=1 Tax=Ruminococcus sp. JE7B6 TaxID=3233380 RepID=UPI00389B1EFB
MCRMKISVIIPFYDKREQGRELLKQAVDSVLSQPYKNIEVIIVDDGCRVDNRRYFESLQLANVKYYRKNNTGAGDSRNYGLRKSAADYVAFLDHDDRWVEGFLDVTIVGELEKNYDVYGFSYFCCSSDLSRGTKMSVDAKLIGGGACAVKSSWNHHSSFIFKRDFLLSHNIEYARIDRNEDEIFRIKALYFADRVFFFDKTIFYYRNNPSSVTHQNIKTEELYVPLINEYIKLREFFICKFPNDNEIIGIMNELICVYSIEAIEDVCASNRKSSEIQRVTEQLLLNEYICNYTKYIKNKQIISRISRFFNEKKDFIDCQKRKGAKRRWINHIKRIPIVNKYYYQYSKKRYPIKIVNSYGK